MKAISPVAIVLVLAACGGSPSDFDNDPSQTAAGASSSAPALDGTWVTDTITAAEIRAVVLDAGFTREDADTVIAGFRTFRFELHFEDGQYELSGFWDEKDVGVIEAGGYRLTEDDRLLLDTGVVGDTFLFDLDIQRDRFTLKLIRSTEKGTAENKYVHSFFTTAFFTVHPFERSE
jgi:hypothetical protein